jgi:preprotein translocase subunit SecF
MRVFDNANFQMMGRTKYVFMTLSAVVFAIAVGVIGVRGFNYGIDFAGGTAVQVKFREKTQAHDLRAALESRDLGDVSIQSIGSAEDREFLIRIEQHAGVEGEGGGISRAILDALRTPEERTAFGAGRPDLNMESEEGLAAWLSARLPAASAGAAGDAASGVLAARTAKGGLFQEMAEIGAIAGIDPEAAALLTGQGFLGRFALQGVEFVGPTAGRELLRKTGYAILGSVIGILIYVYFRFHKWLWGVAAVLALVHDVTISAGAMALTGKEMSLPVVAALLTILGYSINDTIVIFDRIRENLRLYRDHDFEEVVNASVNQTLSRSVLTSFTVWIAVTALLMFGGEKLDPLSFCLLIGVVAGSYSTIFVASALLVVACHRFGARHVKV